MLYNVQAPISTGVDSLTCQECKPVAMPDNVIADTGSGLHLIGIEKLSMSDKALSVRARPYIS